MLDITDEMAGRYHIEFGEDKSKVMKIGRPSAKPTFWLGNMELAYCDQYKYLGVIKNDKNNLKSHIKGLKGKVEAAYQTILAITGNRDFREIKWKQYKC